MKRLLPSIAVLMALTALSSTASAATYYVAQGSAGSGDGTSYSNRASVYYHNAGSGVFGNLDGDTIYLCGPIPDQVYPPDSGSSGSPITYDGDCPGGSPAILTANTWSGALQLTDRSHITVQDLEAKDGNVGIYVGGNGDHITIKRCNLHNHLFRGIFVTSGTHTNVIIGGAPGDGNDIFDCGYNTGGSDISFAHVSGFIISYNHLYGTSTPDRGIDGMALHWSDNGIVEHNRIHSHNDNVGSDLGEDGIDIKQYCNNIDVRYNDIYDHQVYTGITVHFDGYDIDIYGNRIWGNQGGILIFDHNTDDMTQPNGDHVHDIKIWGNLIYDNFNYGMRVYRSTGDSIEDVDIFNNLIAENGNSYGVYFSTGGTGHSIKNNIFYKNVPGGSNNRHVYIDNVDTGDVDLDYNHYYWPGRTSYVHYEGSSKTIPSLPSGIEENGADEDPLMADPDNHDYRLQDGSPCINSGLNLGSAYDDALDPDNTDFNAFPPIVPMLDQDSYGSGWERGAYVYTGGVLLTFECSDSLDNDGDGQTDLSDSGCSSSTDSDESNCGDGSCEGGETQSSCCQDCGTCQTNQTFLPGTPVEAEAGTLSTPMEAGSDPQAYGGSYIQTTTQNLGSVTYTFDIANPGNYYIEARVIAPTTADDSFYVGMDGDPAQGNDPYVWDTIETPSWTWVNVTHRGPGGNDTYAEFDPMVWNLSQGQNTLTIYGRETGTLLDQIILIPLTQGPQEPAQGTYPARKAFSSPAIDGDLSEFSGSDAITLNDSWGTSGTYRLLWDDSALYISADVSDSHLNYDETQEDGSGMWRDDSIEVMFDMEDNGGSSLDSGDLKVFVNLGNLSHDTRGDLSGSWDMDFFSVVIPDGSVNTIDDIDSGYFIEIAIPWSELGMAAPSPSQRWGFELVMNDQDDANSNTRAIWANMNDDTSMINDPGNWGDLLFTVRTDTSGDGCVDHPELMAFINLWYLDSTEYPMGELMEAIGFWKAGTGCF